MMVRSLKVMVFFMMVAASVGSFSPGGLPVFGQTQAEAGTSWPTLEISPAFSGFTQPTHIANAGDGSGRLFIVEKAGRILLARNGVLLPAPFLDIRSRVGSAGGEQGLLSVAFPPEFGSKKHFYVDYTDSNGNTAVSRFRTSADPDVADPDSEQVVLAVPQPFANHNGGQLAFGPKDGYLYISLGDGGSGNDPGNRAQNPAELLGKILRVDVETGDPVTYVVPPTNPFVQAAGFRSEIWAMGLRNPWRFSFDISTGDLYIGDVGQSAREEIDFQPASSTGGENYGWRILEGSLCTRLSECIPPERYSPPVTEYGHVLECSVTGGHVSSRVYYYGDFCSGRIWGLQRLPAGWDTRELLRPAFSISTFGIGEDGKLYVADFDGGKVYSLEPTWHTFLPTITR